MGRGLKIVKSADPEQLRMLKRVPWLSDSGRQKLASDGRLVRYHARQTIYTEQNPPDRVFFLLSGIAKTYYTHRSERILVAMIGPGDTFGLSAMFEGTTRRFACEAVTDCVASSIKPQTFSEAVFGNTFEKIQPALTNTVGRLFEVMVRYTRFVRLDTRGRLALSLLEMADKFGVRDSRGVLIPLSISHSELGGLVGASRQHVTMQLRDFEREGAVIRDGRRLIVIPEKLQAAVDI
jgi:CRP-like cAMP-binding protein